MSLRHAVLMAAMTMAACARTPETPSAATTPSAGVPPAAPSSAPPQTSVADADWILVSVRGRAIPPDSARAPATLRLDTAKGRAEGFAGCNRFSGAFSRRGDSLSFGAVMSTKMACAGPGMDTEMAYLEVLPWVRSYEARDSTLTLIGHGGTLARFVRASAGRR